MGSDDPATGASLATADLLTVLGRGDLDIEGRLVDASNATLVATCELDGASVRCVYKPVAGERPLWDFPDATLGRREVAAYEVSAATGWGLIPPTVWREDGPFGPGMTQLWIEQADDEPGLVDIVARDEVPAGWRRVLEAFGNDGEPVALVHADDPALMRLALLDAVINNADRKGGHVLVSVDGPVFGIDHGVAFNEDDKLRTVLWGWAGEPVPSEPAADLERLRDHLDGSLGSTLAALLARSEVARTRSRCDRLIADAHLPLPAEGWPSIPWPAF